MSPENYPNSGGSLFLDGNPIGGLPSFSLDEPIGRINIKYPVGGPVSNLPRYGAPVAA